MHLHLLFATWHLGGPLAKLSQGATATFNAARKDGVQERRELIR